MNSKKTLIVSHAPFWHDGSGVPERSYHTIIAALPAAFEDRDDAAHVRAAGPLVTFGGREALQADDEMFTFLPMGSDAEALASVGAVVEMGSSALKVWYLRVPAERWAEMLRELFERLVAESA